MDTLQQDSASLFGPGLDSFEEAQAWSRDLKIGDKFVPTHGKEAGYHIEPCDQHIPIQSFHPKYKGETEVTVTEINRACSSDISIVKDPNRPNDYAFYPRVNVNVDYVKG